MTDEEKAVFNDPETTYKILLECHKAGITTEKGKWVIERVEQLKAAGDPHAVTKAIFEASEIWEGFDQNKKLPVN